ncbi:MAG: DUF952 domain-containing protein [Bacteroidetes bacterium]|nr:MAG: DUF952 domain-containing protein [Bacteroidota bacterium]
MPIIYHITTKIESDRARQTGLYESPALKEEGFIHCCEANQVDGVLQRYFNGKKDLVKFVIDTGRLKSQLIYDWSTSIEATFPHIYGPINIDAVVAVEKILD